MKAPFHASGYCNTRQPCSLVLWVLLLSSGFSKGVSGGCWNDETGVNGDIVWSDEFNGENGGLDETTWSFDEGAGDGWGNGELQYYTRDPSNVDVQDGMLKIIARRQDNNDPNNNHDIFTSARIHTKDSMEFLYGTIEARIKVPDTVSGLWPAFWTLGHTFGDTPSAPWFASGEIDIMEVGFRGQTNKRTFSAAHWQHQGTYAVYDSYYDHPTNLNEDFHIYRLEWTPSFLITYIDGIEMWRMDITSEHCLDCTEFHNPHFLILNMAVGGGFTTEADCGGSSSSSSSSSSAWDGGASSGSSGGCTFRTVDDITAPMPAEMLVDWVRIKHNGYTQIPTGCPEPPAPSTPPTKCVATTQYHNAGELVWSDEFSKEMLNSEIWSYDEGDWGWGNGELQDYTQDPSNVYTENGLLHIVARREGTEDNPNRITSGRIKTQGGLEFQYGTLEARIKVPDTVSGLWPAFWMVGHIFPEAVPWFTAGEIDIMEVGWRGRDNRRVFSAAHWEHDDQYVVYDRSYIHPTDLDEAFHNYKLEWTPSFLITYIDGIEMWRMDITPEKCTDCSEFHQAHFILLNLAVGGGFTTDGNCGGSSAASAGGSSGGCTFRTVDDITAPMPAAMLVDWIRLYSNGETILNEHCVEDQPPSATPSLRSAIPTSTPTPTILDDPVGSLSLPSAPTDSEQPSSSPTDCVCRTDATYTNNILTVSFDMCGTEPQRDDWIGIYYCDSDTLVADRQWADYVMAVMGESAFDIGYIENETYVSEEAIWMAYTCGSPDDRCQYRNVFPATQWQASGTVTWDPANAASASSFWAFRGTTFLKPGCYKVMLHRETIISGPPYPSICKNFTQADTFYVS